MLWIPTTKTPMNETAPCYPTGLWLIAALLLLTIGCEDAAQIGDPVDGGEVDEVSACREEPAPSFEPATGFADLGAFTEPDQLYQGDAEIVEVRADALRVETMDGVVETFRWKGADLRDHFHPSDLVSLTISFGTQDGIDARLVGVTKERSDESNLQMMMLWARSEDLSEPLVLPLPSGAPVDGEAPSPSPSLRFGSLLESASCLASLACGETARTTEEHEITVDLAEGGTVAPGEQVVVGGFEFSHVRATIRSDRSDDGACQEGGARVLEATALSVP